MCVDRTAHCLDCEKDLCVKMLKEMKTKTTCDNHFMKKTNSECKMRLRYYFVFGLPKQVKTLCE